MLFEIRLILALISLLINQKHLRSGRYFSAHSTSSFKLLMIFVKEKKNSGEAAFVLAIIDFRSYCNFEKPRRERSALEIARLNRDKCWIAERATKISSVLLRFSFSSLSPTHTCAFAVSTVSFPAIVHIGKEIGQSRGTRTETRSGLTIA